MFKHELNVTDLKTAHTALAELKDQEAIRVAHRGSEAKVIITESRYNDLTKPKSYLLTDTYETKWPTVADVPKSKHVTYESNVPELATEDSYTRRWSTTRFLALKVSVTPMLAAVHGMDAYKRWQEAAVVEMDSLIARLVDDGYVDAFLLTLGGVQLAVSGLAMEYIVISYPCVEKGRELPDYAKPYELAGGESSTITCKLFEPK